MQLLKCLEIRTGRKGDCKMELKLKTSPVAQFLRTVPDTPSHTCEPWQLGRAAQASQLCHSASSWLDCTFFLMGRQAERLLGRRQGSRCPPGSSNRQEVPPKRNLIAVVSVPGTAAVCSGLILPALGHTGTTLHFCHFFSASNTKSFFAKAQSLAALYNLLKRNTGP